ncbi:hypothetical protein J6590_024159 [Homalodisca vitripennis]|nr:hypothetical protein J6590_024159 [Homalodisca vitripennis]
MALSAHASSVVFVGQASVGRVDTGAAKLVLAKKTRGENSEDMFLQAGVEVFQGCTQAGPTGEGRHYQASCQNRLELKEVVTYPLDIVLPTSSHVCSATNLLSSEILPVPPYIFLPQIIYDLKNQHWKKV